MSIDFERINHAALANFPALLQRWIPGGKIIGHEYTGLNPTRNDHRLGSFKVNIRSGRWSDFATNEAGGDPISLAAYLFNLKQGEAAKHLADMLGVSHD